MITQLLKNNFPKYEVSLPVSKKTIYFRPMTVREEKILLLAQQSMSIKQMAQSMVQILKNCCENLTKPEQLAMADAEKLFISIRCKSIGEQANFVIKCPETKESINVNMDLELFEFNDDSNQSKAIKISDNISIILKQPTLSYFLNYDDSGEDELKNLFRNCFLELQTNENLYKKEEIKDEDLNEFYDYMTNKQLSLISDFMNKVPRFKKTISYKGKDGVNREFVLFGIDSFFAYASAT